MKIFYSLLAMLLFAGTNQIFAQANFSSNVVTGNWDVAATWTLTSGTDADGIPDADDNVTILDGHTITITDDASCISLTVGGGTSGTLNIGNSVGDDLTVLGNITVNTGATIIATNTGWLYVTGNITNNGVFDLYNTVSNLVNINFNGTTNQTVSGTGTSTEFNMITINNTGAANNNIVEFATTNAVLLQSSGSLTLTAGIFKMSTTTVNPTTYFTLGSYSIPPGAGFWLNKTGEIVYGQTASLTLGGMLRVTAGIFRVGTVSNNSLEYTGSTAQIIMDGGQLNIQGRLCRDANNASTITYSQTAGNVTVGIGGSTSATRALFEIANTGSSFTLGNGFIILQRANPNFTSDYLNEAGTSMVTGGVNGLTLGNTSTAAGQVFRVNTINPVSGMNINATNTPTVQLVGNGLTTNMNISIGTGCTFITNNLNITVGRNWTNNGTFIGGTSTVTFNGTLSQTLSGTSSTSFYNLVINHNAATAVTFGNAQTVTNSLTLTTGIVTTSTAGLLTLTDNATVTGASDASFINGPVKKTGNDAFTFPVGKSAGGLYKPITISAPANVTDEFTAEYIRGSAATLDADVVLPIKNVSTCDYWTLDRNVGTSSVDVTLSWNANSSCNASQFVTNPATLTVAHYNGAAWDEAGTSGSFTGTATSGTVTRNAVSLFSPFSLGNTVDNENPLPVKFGNLQGYIKNNGVQVDWDIYTEDNVSVYEVQRSANGTQFSNIGSVAARNNGQVGYGFFDAAPLAGMNYYRIGAVDKDGKYSYSITIRINLKKTTADITVYPNPVQDGNISFQSPVLAKDQYTVRLINSIGQEVYSKKIEHSGGPLSYSFQLPAGTKAGVYYLQLENENNKLQKKILIQ